MNSQTKKEINKLKGEIFASNAAIEAEKLIFQNQLKNGLGEEIKDYLKNPPKPNFKFALKIKLQRVLLKLKDYFKRKKA